MTAARAHCHAPCHSLSTSAKEGHPVGHTVASCPRLGGSPGCHELKNTFRRNPMTHHVTRRGVAGAVGALLLATGFAMAPLPAAAQSGEPIKIGFSMALTGPLAANGKQAQLGAKIWEEEINAKGGLLGRKVQLINYDDQSNPATVPGIYTKLLDVDKVDLVVGPYATNMNAP